MSDETIQGRANYYTTVIQQYLPTKDGFGSHNFEEVNNIIFDALTEAYERGRVAGLEEAAYCLDKGRLWEPEKLCGTVTVNSAASAIRALKQPAKEGEIWNTRTSDPLLSEAMALIKTIMMYTNRTYVESVKNPEVFRKAMLNINEDTRAIIARWEGRE